jgi:hypothetical protein
MEMICTGELYQNDIQRQDYVNENSGSVLKLGTKWYLNGGYRLSGTAVEALRMNWKLLRGSTER